MVDTLTPVQRSERMALVRSKDTSPEFQVRRLVHALGYRYRLHDTKLPGKPDLVLASRRAVIFVHGCFWHMHEHRKVARVPKSRIDFWLPKLEANKARDKRNIRDLRRLGWRVLVVWECDLTNEKKLITKVTKFLDASGNRSS